MASPLLAGIPISSRFAEKLGIAQEKQNQQQMTHTKSSTQEDKSWDQTLYEKSDIYRSIKDAYTAPMRAWEGEIDPYSDQGVIEAINLAGVGLTGSIPGGAKGPGSLGIIGRVTPDILKNITDSKITSKIARMEEFVKNNPDRWKDSMVRDPITGRNYFYGPDRQLMIEYQDVKEVPRFDKSGRLENPEGLLAGKKENYAYYERGISHPDKEAAALLEDYMYKRNANNKGNYFQTSDRYSTNSGVVNVDAEKAHLYAHNSKIYNQTEDIIDRIGVRHRINDINAKRYELSHRFATAYTAHEATHALQHKTGAPSGGTPSKEAQRIFKETIGNDPVKLEQYDRATNLATKWMAQDPMSLMVAISQLTRNKNTYTKYVDMLYSTGDEAANNKFFIRKEIKDKSGKVEGIDYQPDTSKILNEILRDTVLGNIKLEGTALEPWYKMNVDAFQAYKEKHGEVYARVAERRAAEAMKGNLDVYRTNPNEFLDVDPSKITYPGKDGLSNISSPIQDLEASVQEQVKQLDSTGWNRLPGAAGKRDSDVQPSVIEKLIKQHPDLIKSNPSMVEKYEIYLRNVKKLPEEEIEKIMMPLWSTYLKDGVKKTTEADPLLTAVEKLAGMIEGMNKPKTVIRDKDGRITGVA